MPEKQLFVMFLSTGKGQRVIKKKAGPGAFYWGKITSKTAKVARNVDQKKWVQVPAGGKESCETCGWFSFFLSKIRARMKKKVCRV